jgi:hypothetical protein
MNPDEFDTAISVFAVSDQSVAGQTTFITVEAPTILSPNRGPMVSSNDFGIDDMMSVL